MTEEQRLQRFIRKEDLPTYIGLKRTQINELIKQGILKPVQASDTGTAVVFLESEILAYQAERIAKRAEDEAARIAKIAPRLKKGRDAYHAARRAKETERTKKGGR